MKNYLKYYSLLYLLTLLFFPARSEAVLPPEEHQKFVSQYLSEADIRLVAEYAKIKFPILAVLKHFGRCTVEYKIIRIQKADSGSPLKAGQRILIDYPCRGKKLISLNGSFYPWIQKSESGNFLLTLRSEDLIPARNETWILDNHNNLFVPMVPDKYWN